jgi:hypothetical protein
MKIPTPGQPLRVIYDGQYDYVGLWRYPAHCWLRVYVPSGAGDVPVVIATQVPDNEGTSVTNFAEQLAWKVTQDQMVWAQAPGAARAGFTWIEHYPWEEYPEWKTSHEETFMRVTFAAVTSNLGDVTIVGTDPETGDSTSMRTFDVSATEAQGALGEPTWEDLTREQVEQLIGQPFPPIG